MPEIKFVQLETTETPKEILEADFPSLGTLPIRGGWGYTPDTACLIDKYHPSVDPNRPFDGIGYEYMLAEYRVYEELIIFRSPDDCYAGIRSEIQRQKLKEIDGRKFDCLIFSVRAFREDDFEKLKSEYEGPEGYGTPNFDAEAHERKHNELLCTGIREYWFDITSFFGQGLILPPERPAIVH